MGIMGSSKITLNIPTFGNIYFQQSGGHFQYHVLGNFDSEINIGCLNFIEFVLFEGQHHLELPEKYNIKGPALLKINIYKV